MDNRVFYFVLMAVLISFLGFMLENIWLAVTKGFIDNRNMRFPFLWGYGLFISGLYILMGIPEDFVLSALPEMKSTAARYISYFAVVFLIVSAGEIFLGKVTEDLFGFYYWNYERLPLHLTRYTSVPTSTGFALIITFFMSECYMPILYALEKIPLEIAKPAAVIGAVVLTWDLITSFIKMHKEHAPNIRWIRYFQNGKKLSDIKAK